MCIGILGFAPDAFWGMTPAEVHMAMHGHRMRERAEWQRTLHVANRLTGEKTSVDDLFGEKKQVTLEDVQALRARHGW